MKNLSIADLTDRTYKRLKVIEPNRGYFKIGQLIIIEPNIAIYR